ncbi:MAG TPA: CoB--CoM heterodisulfide reductase iron-sulfur subunit A family protein, partial [Anaerolineae bacterium]|nr:CoB--CoM heterodisulfide reductase iron-sulfur subunit A family protein [Anaerolineae bacterium]
AIARLLAGARKSPAPPAREAPPERDVSEEEPRVGVFACRCDGIEEVVDLARVLDHARGLKDVAHVQEVAEACNDEGLKEIKRQIAEKGLNRVVVAGCTHRLYEAPLQEALREAGLNPALLERADLREGCAWAHWDQPEAATAKAQELVEMAVAKARLLKPVPRSDRGVTTGALVIGGGLAGMTAALSLAEQGFPVHLVEREAELGGNLRHVHYTLYGGDAQALLRSLVRRVEENELIRVHRGAEVSEVSGCVGNFTVRVSDQGAGNQGIREQVGEASVTFEVGAIIVATGGQEAVPTEYLYGEDPRVMTQREFEAMLAESESDASLPSSVVMIQCVGSREPDRPYCSRICCSQAIKNGLRLKEVNPRARVFVLYRDIRTYGFKEEAYRQAREAGGIFIPYDLDDKPQVVARDEGLRVLARDPVLGERLTLDADLVVLSTGIVPNENGALAGILGVPLDADGFFQEANSKVRPMDFERAGIFLCGLAQAPHFMDETIVQAEGAALRAAILLRKGRLESRPMVASVNERLCSACELCVQACPYGARFMDLERGVAAVDPILCQGCGVCVMVCPNGASQQNTFEMQQVMAMLDATI